MERCKCVIVSGFLVFILVFSSVLFARRVIDLDKVWGDMRVLGKAADEQIIFCSYCFLYK